MGGRASPKIQRLIANCPLYRIYHIGSVEIGYRMTGGNGLSTRSIQAIRASLDAGYVRENHALNDGCVFLTISIAGGPFMGLLGTVVGVMITFAAIAATGEVNISANRARSCRGPRRHRRRPPRRDPGAARLQLPRFADEDGLKPICRYSSMSSSRKWPSSTPPRKSKPALTEGTDPYVHEQLILRAKPTTTSTSRRWLISISCCSSSSSS